MIGIIYFIVVRDAKNIKLEHFDAQLLKPDTIEYEFHTYFIINFMTGEIEINPINTAKEQEKARFTKDFLQLNAEVLCKARLRESKKQVDNINDCSYRFMFL